MRYASRPNIDQVSRDLIEDLQLPDPGFQTALTDEPTIRKVCK